MKLEKYNAKHYCSYYNICEYLNGKYIYCSLQLQFF